MSASAQDFPPGIEGLRALAVAGVVACHFGLAALPGGFVGVNIFFVISGLVFVVLCAWLTSVSQPWAFYFSPLRAWEFAAGGLASLAPARLLQARPLLGRALSLGGLAMIGAAYLAFSEDAPFPGFLALLPVAGTVLLLKAGAAGARDGYSPDSGRNWVNAALALPPLQWTCRLSYSTHLWHWPVIVYAGMLAPELTPIERLYCLALTLALSALTYRLIENPIRRNGWLMANAARAPVPVLLLTGTGVAAAYGNARLAVHDLAGAGGGEEDDFESGKTGAGPTRAWQPGVVQWCAGRPPLRLGFAEPPLARSTG
ncbi:acyltransferase [Mesorhizobium sp.]|uniref:acyltransferase family protein n=1 Tax=Mesorhizobium sp. TaxID=1871066 RepID=UPI0025BDED88|nr:acyltransferase [Mesorhizobium sp.]